jgi:hypothetical protein
MNAPYIHALALRIAELPVNDTLTLTLNRQAARQLKDLLARALNCLPEAEWKDWYELSDKLEMFGSVPMQMVENFVENGL